MNLVGARPEVAATLAKLGVNKRLPDGHHHLGRLEALRHAAATIAGSGDPAPRAETASSHSHRRESSRWRGTDVAFSANTAL